MVWFWRFLIYSFLGFLLEVAFARLTRQPKQDRKCLILLPLCPVYGFGAVLILYLTSHWNAGPLLIMLIGFGGASAAEYLFDLFYERVLGVRFWNYENQPLNLNGRVCILFSLAWTVLALTLVYRLAPAVDLFIARIPPALTPIMAILFTSDAMVSCRALKRAGTTDVLRWYKA